MVPPPHVQKVLARHPELEMHQTFVLPLSLFGWNKKTLDNKGPGNNDRYTLDISARTTFFSTNTDP